MILRGFNKINFMTFTVLRKVWRYQMGNQNP